jgi:hypothetical protein
MKDASLLVDYVYLDSEERRRFAQVGHEYLIEQCQFTGIENVNDGSTVINQKYKLGFNHPCKEIVWALQNGSYNGSSSNNLNSTDGRFLTYTHDDAKWQTDGLDYAAENLGRGMVSLEQPTASGVDYLQIALDPLATSVSDTTANGVTVNILYSGLVSTTLSVWIIENPLVYGSYNLGSFIGEMDVNLVLGNSGTTVTGYSVDIVSHSLSLTDVSVPVGDFTDNRSTTAANGLNPYDFSVVLPSNYGVRLDGKGNPVLQGNLQFNGHDRFDMREGAYFNYVQPHQHHTRTPADGVNVYSFALHPENHQPSGSANLSRIDNTYLILSFSDPLRANQNVPKLNLSRDSDFYVFATNYNILRIMSGMGGLAYSN